MRLSLFVCLVLYTTIGLCGVAAFGASVDHNILVSLGSPRGACYLPHALATAVSGAMSIIMVCAYPINAYGLRVGLHQLMHEVYTAHTYPSRGRHPTDGEAAEAETTAQRWAGATFIVLLSTAVGFVVDDLGVLFQVRSPTISFTISPGLPACATRHPAVAAARSRRHRAALVCGRARAHAHAHALCPRHPRPAQAPGPRHLTSVPHRSRLGS